MPWATRWRMKDAEVEDAGGVAATEAEAEVEGAGGAAATGAPPWTGSGGASVTTGAAGPLEDAAGGAARSKTGRRTRASGAA